MPLICTNPEAEFLDIIGTKVLRVFLLAINSHLYNWFTPLPPLSKSGLKLVCNVNIVYGQSGNHQLADPPNYYYKYVHIILDSQSCCFAWSVRIKYIFSLQLLVFPAFTVVTSKWSDLFDTEYSDLQVASADVLAAARCFADALQVLFGLLYILAQFMCVHIC